MVEEGEDLEVGEAVEVGGGDSFPRMPLPSSFQEEVQL